MSRRLVSSIGRRFPGNRRIIMWCRISAAGPSETGSTALGPLPDAMKPGFHCARTHWIRGFTAFRLARLTRAVRLTVPM
jgi:hypothetical protein